MNIIDFLPENSFERTIIENKYIDRMNWEKICNENHSSKSRTSRYWKKGLYKLLEYEKVRKTLDEYKKSM